MAPDVEAPASPAGRGSREYGLSHGDAYAGPASPGRVDGLYAGDGDAYDVSCESDKGLGASDGRVGVEHDSHVPSAGGRDRELMRQLSELHGPRLDGEPTRQLPSQGGLGRGPGGEVEGGEEGEVLYTQ